ncbi:aldehyde dehydrogenase family protein, partial [Staphylococcus aureus]
MEETLQLEVFPTISSLAYCRQHLPRWMRPETRRVEPAFWFARNSVAYQPLGVVGVIAPGNYPFYLAIA